jgi:hypothetical protein
MLITLSEQPERRVKWIGVVGYRLDGLADGLLRRAFGDPLQLPGQVHESEPAQLAGERLADVGGSSQVGHEIVHVTSEVM